MMDIASSDFVRQPTADSDHKTIRSRLDDLNHLSSDRIESLFGSTGDASEESHFRSPTAVPPQKTGEPLYFRQPSKISPRVTRFTVEQEFEGMVVSVDQNGDFFVARLADLTAKGPEEEAEIAFDEISPDDRPLIVPGALFSWSIGKSTETGGQVRRVSELRFRRFFRFTPSAIVRAEEKAARMLELLNDGYADQAGKSTGSQ
jgi:hypothetical protein